MKYRIAAIATLFSRNFKSATGSYPAVMNLSKVGKAIAASALLMYSANSQAILILDVDIDGTNRYNNTVVDGDESYVDFSGFGGWSLTIASAVAEPDFSGGPPEIHLSVIANCSLAAGCAALTVTAASDIPWTFDQQFFVDLGFTPGAGSSGSFSAFTGDTISARTESQTWTDDFEGHIAFTNAAPGTLWGLQVVLVASAPSANSADFRIVVPEPSTLSLFMVGLLGMGMRRRGKAVRA